LSGKTMSADWVAEFDGFLSNEVMLESDILDIDEAFEHDCGQLQEQACCTNLAENPTPMSKDFQEESSMCCVCWEPFLTEKETRLVFLEKKQILLPFALPCLHIGHLHCLKKLVSMRCIQKCCGRCAAQIPEQLFGIILHKIPKCYR
jgi:hypothetical protein